MKKLVKANTCWTFVIALTILLQLRTDPYDQMIIGILIVAWVAMSIVHTVDFIRSNHQD